MGYMGCFLKGCPTNLATCACINSRESTSALECLLCSSIDLAAIEQLQVPSLRCSFPLSLHPQYEEVKKQCDGWIVDLAQPPSPAARQLLLDCVLPLLICRSIPTASSLTRLVHVTKMVAWLTIADDEHDHPDLLGADDVSTSHHASQVLSILCQDIHPTYPGTPTCTISPRSDLSPQLSCAPLETKDACSPESKKTNHREAALLSLTSLWADMRCEMSPILCSRFVSTMVDYFNAIRVQATYRKAHILPNVEAYMEIRRHASFFLPCFVLLEYALGIELDDATYNNVHIKEFRNLATDYICLCNDLISCKMEMKVGDYFNMPFIIYRAGCNEAVGDQLMGSWTLQAAMDCVSGMVHDLDAQCASMFQSMVPTQPASTSTLPSPHANANAQFVGAYLCGLRSCMSGSLAWYLETARYKSK